MCLYITNWTICYLPFSTWSMSSYWYKGMSKEGHGWTERLQRLASRKICISSALEYLLEEKLLEVVILVVYTVLCLWRLCVWLRKKLGRSAVFVSSWSLRSLLGSVGDLGWVLLNSCGGVLAQRAYQRGDLPFFAKFLGVDTPQKRHQRDVWIAKKIGSVFGLICWAGPWCWCLKCVFHMPRVLIHLSLQLKPKIFSPFLFQQGHTHLIHTRKCAFMLHFLASYVRPQEEWTWHRPRNDFGRWMSKADNPSI